MKAERANSPVWKEKKMPSQHRNGSSDRVSHYWEACFDHVVTMSDAAIEQLERKLLSLRRSIGLTPSQVDLLRAILARRVQARFVNG
jgi:hypothetical protein